MPAVCKQNGWHWLSLSTRHNFEVWVEMMFSVQLLWYWGFHPTPEMSANVEGRGVSMSCSSPPAEVRFSDSSMTIVADTLNVCRMTQSMIDITAKQLFGLRQCRTSEDLIQKEICECEVCIVFVVDLPSYYTKNGVVTSEPCRKYCQAFGGIQHL